jgi:S1-C subfamily serine protease
MSAARMLGVAGAAAIALGACAVTPGGHDAAPRLHAVVAGGEHATGFAAGGDRVVTVAHVLDAGRPLTVDGRRARVVRVDRAADLALLALPGLHAAPVRMGAGEPGAVRLLGHRARVRRAITATVRVAPGEAVARRAALELAAVADPGDSGAPLLAGDGRVVGVLFAASRDRAETAYAVDGSALRALLAGGRSELES